MRDYLKVNKSFWINPAILLCAPWLTAASFFLFKWTGLKVYAFNEIFPLIIMLLGTFIVCYSLLFLVGLSLNSFILKSQRHIVSIDVKALSGRLKPLFVFWAVISVIEILLSRGLPVIWLITGSSLNYMDFGLRGLHGLMNSLLLACSLFSMLLFFVTRKRQFLIIPVISFIWGVAVISRALILSNMLQILILYVYIYGFSFREFLKVAVMVLLFILVFGVIGDFRSGEFSEFVGVTESYPSFLPSGFLWVYVYMMTPINNLYNTCLFMTPSFDLSFENTLSSLFPSFIRKLIFDTGVGQQGDLVTEAFNISTAYIGPYKDYGNFGIVILSIFYAIISFFSWRSQTLSGMITYVIIAHCLLVSIFFNWIFFLPVAFQFVWLQFMIRRLVIFPIQENE